MSRYKAEGTWDVEHGFPVAGTVQVQSADARDTKTGDIFRQGAFRVLVDDRPVKGKGGTVPFYGESAWSDAQRLAGDLSMKIVLSWKDHG